MISLINCMELHESRRQRYYEKLENLDLNYSLAQKGLKNLSKENSLKLEIYGVLHAIQLTIERITDISAMFMKDQGKIVKNTYDNLNEIYLHGMLTNTSKNSLFNLVGLRNRIAHDYNGLDEDLALNSFKENIDSVSKFINGVKKWIGKS
ncbi:MAG: DUF86 domain-containing protein [Promethearchaeota archaeon]|nr:MAG: DUF86 domain-containing protein [Candidatus Lokiarchaeota archaeon]